MKKILLILLTTLSLNLYGQSVLDMMVFDRINDYRVENSLKPFIFDTLVWKAANHHSIYLAENKYLSHYEDVLKMPSDRLRSVGITITKCSGENVNAFPLDGESDEYLSLIIFTLWVRSPIHNELLLKDTPKYGAVSSYTISDVLYSTLNVYR